jgi:ElaB/YqjD/DUF883 family membrane-anchored ribosome-binding protein
MGQDKGQVGTPVENEKSPDEIRRDIEDTREQLGDTAAALAAKTDVKARAKEKVAGVKQSISEKAPSGDGPSQGASPAEQVKVKVQQNPIAAAAIGAFVGGFLFGRISSRG